MIESSKIEPLKYIQYFLKKESLEAFENNFYSYNGNPSLKINKKEGWIYYLKSEYRSLDEKKPYYDIEGNLQFTILKKEEPFIKLFFADKLEKHLLFETKTIISLVNQRKNEIESTEKNANIYINKQLSKLEMIRQKFNYFKAYQPIVFEVLDNLENDLSGLLEGDKNKPALKIYNPKAFYNSYFRLKKQFKLKHLKNLYSESVDLNIIDDDDVSEDDFLNVFSAPRLPLENHKIIFNMDNRLSVFYINTISALFDNLSARPIHNSEAFYNKQGKLLNENDINKANSYLNNNDVSKYDYIKTVLPK